MSNVVEEDDGTKPANNTINYALQIVNRNANSFPDWKLKELGLQLSLFGLAEKQATRISNLSTIVIDLEQEVFSEENLRQIEPSKLVGLYRMAVEAQRESAEYIRTTIKSIDWQGVETQLMQLAASEGVDGETPGESDLREIASQLLKSFTSKSLG